MRACVHVCMCACVCTCVWTRIVCVVVRTIEGSTEKEPRLVCDLCEPVCAHLIYRRPRGLSQALPLVEVKTCSLAVKEVQVEDHAAKAGG